MDNPISEEQSKTIDNFVKGLDSETLEIAKEYINLPRMDNSAIAGMSLDNYAIKEMSFMAFDAEHILPFCSKLDELYENLDLLPEVLYNELHKRFDK